MERKSVIIRELESAVKTAVTEHSRDGAVSDDATQQICNVIEAIFIHGLRDAFFVKNSRYSKYPEPNFWPFVSKFTHKAIKTQIAGLAQIRNEIGKARAWVRIVLNEGAFENYLNILSKDRSQLNVFYTNSAFLRDDEKVEALIGYLKALSKVSIAAPFNSTFLNGWTPSPLTTAGLILGAATYKPTKTAQSPVVQSRMARRDVSSNSSLEEEEEEEETEVALNAGDMLGESAPNIETLSSTLEESALFAQSPDIGVGDDDERSSVYSHPSMLDGGCSIPLRPSFVALLSSTPENGLPPFPLPDFYSTRQPRLQHSSPTGLPREEQSSEVIVHRKRVVRQRRNSRSSSRSDGEERRSLTGGDRDDKSQNAEMQSLALAPETHDRLMSIIAPEVKDESGDDDAALTTTQCGTFKAPSDENDGGTSSNPDEALQEDAMAQGDDCLDTKVKLIDEQELPPTPFATSAGEEEVALGAAVVATSYEVEKAPSPPSVPIPAPGQRADDDVFATSLRDELNISALDEVIASHGTPRTSAVHIEEANHHGRMGAEEAVACSSSSLSTDYSGPMMMSLDSALLGAVKIPSDTASSSSSDVRTLNLRPDLPATAPDKQCLRSEVNANRSPVSQTKQASPSTSSVREHFSKSHQGRVTVKIEPRSILSGQNRAIFKTIFSLYSRFSLHLGMGALMRLQANAEAEQSHEPMEPAPDGEKLGVLFSIPIEKGLDAQEFRCPSCQKSIGGTSFKAWHLCNLDGRLYCQDCMSRGEESIIPARVILNWDTRPRAISKASKALLKSVASRPLFHVELMNPRLYEHCRPMKRVEQLRRKLSLVVMYLLNCKQSVADDIRKRIWPHEHWYIDRHFYSLEDLEGVASGALEKKIDSICAFALNHVNGCALCLQKGFVCELCSSKRLIYPFQVEHVERCPKCFSVFHKECLAVSPGGEKRGPECPKCMRRRKHSSSANLTIKSPLSHQPQLEATSAPMFTLPLPSI